MEEKAENVRWGGRWVKAIGMICVLCLVWVEHLPGDYRRGKIRGGEDVLGHRRT